MILLNMWANDTQDDVFKSFEGVRWDGYKETSDSMPISGNPRYKGAQILLASYGGPAYEGYAFVLFLQDGKLFEVNGSHCSCYGLEGQWEPEETTIDSLRHRVKVGKLGNCAYEENPFAKELLEVLVKLEGH